MDTKKNKYVLVYQHQLPMTYKNDGHHWENYIFQKLNGMQLDTLVITNNEKLLSLDTFQSVSISDSPFFIRVRRSEFMKYRFTILRAVDILCAIIIIYDPQTKMGKEYDNTFCIGQRNEVCGMILPFLAVPVFLVSLSKSENTREWSSLLWEQCMKLANEKHRYCVDQPESVLEDFQKFLATIK